MSANTNAGATTVSPVENLDVVIVGAGFAGMYMLHRMRQQGRNVRCFEAGSGVGGTWYWNRYPGARCDIESMEYSYKFDEQLQQDWTWTERYSTQPEILSYANHVADRFNLRENISFNTRVTSAQFDDSSNRWLVETSAGDRVSAHYLITATGCLSMPNRPTFKGQETFEGSIYYTSGWPHEGVDFTDKKVAVIGTGSSGIQSIPLIAEQAKFLTVFQRTPNFCVPAGNRPLAADEIARVKAEYQQFRARNVDSLLGFNLHFNTKSALEVTPEEREAEYERRWNEMGGLLFMGAFSDLLLSKEANDTLADFIRRKVRGIVKNPKLAEKLVPQDHVVGCKRLCSDSEYFETFNRDNVDLVDVNEEPISEITTAGLKFGERSLDVDAIIFATGFDAMTGALLAMNMQGRGGVKLRDKWAAGPRTYMGLTTVDFPNLFMITGPGSPSVLSNMIMSIEEHVDWISTCIGHLDREGITRIEPTEAMQEAWMEEVSAVGNTTLYPTCNSWYVGSNIPGKARSLSIYLGFSEYAKKVQQIASNGYAEFKLDRTVAVA